MIDSSLFVLSPSHIPSWNFASTFGALLLVFFDVMYMIFSPNSTTGACASCPRASLYAVLLVLALHISCDQPCCPLDHPREHRVTRSDSLIQRSEQALHSLNCVLNSAVALRFAHGAVHWHCVTLSQGNHLFLYVCDGNLLVCLQDHTWSPISQLFDVCCDSCRNPGVAAAFALHLVCVYSSSLPVHAHDDRSSQRRASSGRPCSSVSLLCIVFFGEIHVGNAVRCH